eukprot:4011128-Alexandrium_andersonii.AAC.1
MYIHELQRGESGLVDFRHAAKLVQGAPPEPVCAVCEKCVACAPSEPCVYTDGSLAHGRSPYVRLASAS